MCGTGITLDFSSDGESVMGVDTAHDLPVVDATESTSTSIRWKLLLLLLLAWAVLQGGAWWYVGDDRTYQILSTLYISPAMAFLVLLWFLLISRIALAVRFKIVAGLLSLVGAFFATMRHDGYTGEMIPVFAFRWHPTTEQQARMFFQRTAREAAPQTQSNKLENSAAALTVAADDWPQFRGPRRDGVADAARFRRDWDERPPELIWRHPVGQGWSSFAIVGEWAFTQEQRDDEEVVVCYRADTGRQVWVHADAQRFRSGLGGDGPRGTPTVHASRVYTLGATGKLNCLEALSGTLLWSRDVLADARADNLEWGLAGSPLIDQGRVIVTPGGGNGKSVLAYAVEDGRLVWSRGDHPASYSALRREILAGKPQLLLFDGQGLAGLDPASGAEFWRKPWQNQPRVNVAQPIIHEGQVLISSGYGLGSALLDVSRVNKDRVPATVWNARNRFKMKFNDAVYRDGAVYGLDEGILSCLDAATGRRLWKRGRFGYGQLLLAGDTLIVMGESGVVALVAADRRKFRELARFQALDDVTWNHPVLHRGRLFVRNSAEAACYDVSLAAAPPADQESARGPKTSAAEPRADSVPAVR